MEHASCILIVLGFVELQFVLQFIILILQLVLQLVLEFVVIEFKFILEFNHQVLQECFNLHILHPHYGGTFHSHFWQGHHDGHHRCGRWWRGV